MYVTSSHHLKWREDVTLEGFLMANAEVHPIKSDYAGESEARVAEFEEGLRRGVEQYETGQVKTFDDKAKFLTHLRSL